MIRYGAGVSGWGDGWRYFTARGRKLFRSTALNTLICSLFYLNSPDKLHSHCCPQVRAEDVEEERVDKGHEDTPDIVVDNVISETPQIQPTLVM